MLLNRGPNGFGGGVSVIGGPDNGMNGENFFLSGEEVAPTVFLSSGYDPQYHTVEGMTSPDGNFYAPQLSAGVRSLLQAPCTVVLDSTFPSTDSPFKTYILCDAGGTYLEVILASAIFYGDNTASLNPELGAPLSIGRHKIAFTRTEGSVSISVDGGTVVVAEADSLTSMSTVVLGVGGIGTTIHEFTIYASPIADGGLPTLSAL